MAANDKGGAELAEDSISADDWAAAMAEQGVAAGEVALSEEATGAGVAVYPDGGQSVADERISLILDIPVNVTVELGRTKLPIRSLLQLAQGSVVELDALAGEPMDVLVNGCLIAQGEVVVVNDKFGIRLTDIITPAERLRRLSVK
ncbi:MAG: flagellar motor switch protein FliN [Rhodocyclaceae bacterium]|nr:flagellar motor switch protein FliN [Rhodocyclaceae bacterium]